MPRHASEYNGKRRAGLPLPALPIPLKKIQHRILAQNLTGDPDGNMPADPAKSFWHGGDRIQGEKLASQILAKQAADEEIEEQWG